MRKTGFVALLLVLAMPTLALASPALIKRATAIKDIKTALNQKWGKPEAAEIVRGNYRYIRQDSSRGNWIVALGKRQGPARREFSATAVGVMGRKITVSGFVDMQKSVPKNLGAANRVTFGQRLR